MKAWRTAVAMMAAGIASGALAQQPAPAVTPGLPAPAAATRPAVEPLGGSRYRVGAIIIDKSAGTFAVPGAVIDLGNPDAPIEFVVTTRGGAKNYESLIEVDADAYEFNLACILIGLTPRPEAQPDGHFDPEPIDGDPLSVAVSWKDGDDTVRLPAGRLLSASEGSRIVDTWVYTGSRFEENGDYRAHVAGALVGVVHDRDSVIHHRTGLALGSYGDVTANPGAVPEPGTPVTVTITRLDG